MPIRATRLRADLYNLLDRVLETGRPIEIERHGRLLRISPVIARRKLDALEPHPDYLRGDPDALVHLDGSTDWKP